MSGSFVTIEGCEGVGKSTQLRFLKEYCQKNNIDAVFTREPGGTPVAEKIREIILFEKSEKIDETCETMLYCAARAQHVAKVITPSLQQGKIVICDRFSLSTLAYQGFGRGVDKDMIGTLNRFALGGLKPMLTIFLNVPPDQGFLRKGGRDESDRMEAMDMDFHRRVYEGFVSAEDDYIVKLDASGTKYETHEKIIALLKSKGIF